MANTINNFDLPKSGYVAFDAISLRELIIDRLNEQKTFTDQNFIGSNLAAIIDIVAYSYHTLIYYLNKTSSESMFTESQLYENMNRIVKLIDYSPIGYQTSTLSFTCSALNLPLGLHTIPRYSYLNVNGVSFSFNEDITFIKQTTTTEFLEEISRQKLLYQGQYQEYPIYTATGIDHETVILNTANELVDHFNIDVYVKPALTNVWEQYSKTASLYLENSSATKYEIRLNGNKRYELKFGNDINGKKLQPGDQVAIYYLQSTGITGEIGPRALSLTPYPLIRYSTPQYSTILNNVLKGQYNLIESNETRNFTFDNANNSTPIKEAETADNIRQVAPSYYRTQYRLVTTRDYENFVSTNFANLIAEVKVINNWEYVSTYLKYFYDIGIQDPQKTERALLNQVLYADACNFNNVYLIVVPRSGTQNFDYLVPAQKELISTSILTNKMATTETVFIDPVYKSVSLGFTDDIINFEPEIDKNNFKLEVVKSVASRRDNQAIINDIVNVFTAYFSRETVKLGQTIDLRILTQQILGVDGVRSFYTVNTITGEKVEGLSILVWNPTYPENDKVTTSNSVPLQIFEFPYFDNINSLSDKIIVTTRTTVFETSEY
jgi:hypothetical protein